MSDIQPTVRELRELGDVFDQIERRRAPSRGRARLALASMLALGTLTALTPQGQALAEQIGELMGIGDEPREEGNYGPSSLIVGVGETPRGHAYEAVVSGELQPGQTCVFLGFPEIKGTGMGSCLTSEIAQGLASEKVHPLIYRAPHGILPDGGVVLQGLAAADVARVEIGYRDENGASATLPAALSVVSGDFIERVGLGDEQFQFFVSFLPPGAVDAPVSEQTVSDLRDIRIRAFGSGGAELAERGLEHTDPETEVWLDQPPLGRLPDETSGD